MSVPAFAGLRNYMASAAGASFVGGDPALRPLLQVVTMAPAYAAPTTPNNLQALGPLAASLPADFAQRASAARTSEDPEDSAAMGKMIAQAYAASVETALAEIDARALAAAQGAAADPAKLAALNATAAELKAYSIYGEAARSRVAVFSEQAAAARTQDLAGKIAERLLRESRRAEPVADSVQAGGIDANGFARGRARLGKPSERARTPATGPAVQSKAAEVPARFEKKDWFDGFNGGPAHRFFSRYERSLRDIPGVKDVQVGRFNLYYQDSGFPELKPWGVKIEVSADADMKAIEAALEPYKFDGIQIGVTSGRWKPYAMSGYGNSNSGAFGLDPRTARTDAH